MWLQLCLNISTLVFKDHYQNDQASGVIAHKPFNSSLSNASIIFLIGLLSPSTLSVKLISPNTDLLEDIGEISIADLETLDQLRHLLTQQFFKEKHFGFINKDLKFIHPRTESSIPVDRLFSTQIRVKLFEDKGTIQ